MSLIGDFVENADSSGRFLSGQELNAIKNEAGEAGYDTRRIDIVNRITDNTSAIARDAARSLFFDQSVPAASGGTDYSSSRMADFLSNMKFVLRYITYSMIIGDKDRELAAHFLDELQNNYRDIGVPSTSVILAMHKARDASLNLLPESKDTSNLRNELSSYFDQVVKSVV